MKFTYGQKYRFEIFGASHAPEIGVTIDGLPAGFAIDLDTLAAFLKRRAPGQNAWSTPRKEADLPEFRTGLTDGNVTTGEPLTAVIKNTNTRSSDYDELKYKPRPGHADYTAFVRYNGLLNMQGGGPFSGRMTAPYCIAGGIALQLLEKKGVRIMARVKSIGDITDDAPFTAPVDQKAFPAVDDAAAEKMQALIQEAKAAGDSVGGTVELIAEHVPAGFGGPLFEGMEGRIAAALFAIPAVKGVEFGEGFNSARLKGSENNDPFVVKDGRIKTATNHAGGILGGITDGMPITLRVAFKPTPSIAQPQKTVNLETMEETELQIKGRHDPCIVPRAVPVVEAAVAAAIYDALLD